MTPNPICAIDHVPLNPEKYLRFVFANTTTADQIHLEQRSRSAMQVCKYSQSGCKTIRMVFPVSCPLGKSEAVHQANRSMEKDCLVNEVWSGATEGCVCHWIYSAAAPWFPAAVKQWGGDWSKLDCSCQPPDCLQPSDGISLSLTNCLSPVPLLTRVRTNMAIFSPNLPHSLYLCLIFSLPLDCFHELRHTYRRPASSTVIKWPLVCFPLLFRSHPGSQDAKTSSEQNTHFIPRSQRQVEANTFLLSVSYTEMFLQHT